jgi:hypothetical protein
MKKILLVSIAGIFLLISTTATVNGQIASNHVKPTARFAVSNKPESKNSLVGRVNPTVIRSFLKTYKDVSDETWIDVKEGFVAMFNHNGIDYQVAYDKKGNLLRTIRSYNEENMPPDLRHVVRSNYYDYDINRVHEIEKPFNPVTYVIQLVGKREVINLGVSDGEMEELGKFNKSK